MSKNILNWCDKVKTKLQRWTLTPWWWLLASLARLVSNASKPFTNRWLDIHHQKNFIFIWVGLRWFIYHKWIWMRIKTVSLMSILLGSWVHCCTWKLKHKHSKRANSGRLICNFLSYTVAFDNLLGAWLKEWWILFFLSNAINFCKTC